jgi:hypothetical protein
MLAPAFEWVPSKEAISVDPTIAAVKGTEAEVSPHFPEPDQQLRVSSGGKKCAHGAVFKATKPDEDC